MKKLFFFIVFLTACLSIAVARPAMASPAMQAKHQSVTCQQCHGEATPTAAVKINCTQCHGSAEDVAKKTAEKYKKHYNPHEPLHYGTYALCENCHRQHGESRLECNNSNCHKEFKYLVP